MQLDIVCPYIPLAASKRPLISLRALSPLHVSPYSPTKGPVWPAPATPSMALFTRASLLVLLLHVVAFSPHPDKRTNKDMAYFLLHPKGLKSLGHLVSMKKPEALQAKKPQDGSQEAGLRWKRGLLQRAGLATLFKTDYGKDWKQQ